MQPDLETGRMSTKGVTVCEPRFFVLPILHDLDCFGEFPAATLLAQVIQHFLVA
jgi:hypothetical protein